jgi:hypothetical protein
MFKPKTHFEQIPLEMVRKIVEEQIQREIAAEQAQGTKERTLQEDLLWAQEQSMTSSRAIPRLEV